MSRSRGSSKASGPARAGLRGWAVDGGGQPGWLQPSPEFRATTVQACGLWPFAAGAGAPMTGVPVGRHLATGATVCMDPISWFMRANLISNPSMFTLGLPGLGKSSLTRRICLGLAGYGVLPLILGDLRPDYVQLIRAIGGQVIAPGQGARLNILDPGDATDAARQLTGEARESVLADAHRRRVVMMTALLTISRRSEPTDTETAVLDRALRVLDERLANSGRAPELKDVYQIIEDAPETIREVVLDRGSIDRYQEATSGLQRSLQALLTGRLGEFFSGQTTTPMRLDRPVAFDVSAIGDNDHDLQAAALMACWSTGFASVHVSNVLADAGLGPRRYYFVVLDELWRALRAGAGMVDRVDQLTRLNRAVGVGMSMISHTFADLDSLPRAEDRAKAKGFIERAGIVVTGGLPSKEIPDLGQIVRYSDAEADMLASWSTPPGWSSMEGRESEPPGRGKFLIKVGERPGIPFRTQLTRCEREVNDTNRMWHRDPAAAVRLEDSLNVDPEEQEFS